MSLIVILTISLYAFNNDTKDITPRAIIFFHYKNLFLYPNCLCMASFSPFKACSSSPHYNLSTKAPILDFAEIFL